MNVKSLIPLFALVMAVGWFLPESGALPEQQNADQSASQFEADDEADWEEDGGVRDNDYGTISLGREADGHFYADVDVNGEPIRFLVDTGASHIALTGADAEALDLDWDESNLQLVGRGASGDVYGRPVILDELQLGPFTARNVPAAIIPEGLDRSLLGQAFLRQIENVNISGDQMVLR